MISSVTAVLHDLPLERIESAREVIAGRIHRTPVLTSSTAAAFAGRATGTQLGDERLYLKAEHLQKTGSFKARGMTARVAALAADEVARGIVTMSAGNAAQAYAWAARERGVHCVVVMPESAVPSKVEACLGYGAEVVLEGRDVGETARAVERLRDERGLIYCHQFDDPDVIAGHGSIGLELLEDLPDLDVLVVPVGGGGLICGIAAAIKQRSPSVRVYGVEPERSNALSLALEAGEVVPIRPVSVADGLGAPFAGRWTLDLARRYVDDIVLLTDAEILAGLRFAIERTKQVLEPAGAAALAAVLHGRVPIRSGDHVAAVLSGGNVDVARLGELIAAAGSLAG